MALSVCDGAVNGGSDYYTRPLHNLPKGVCLQGRIYHLRRRVPHALRTVIGRSELWRSLRTDSVQIALRRVHFAAAEIEAELEAARAAIGLLVDPYAPRSSTRPSGGSSLSLLVEKVAERLSIERTMPVPAAPPPPDAKSLGEVYDLYTAEKLSGEEVKPHFVGAIIYSQPADQPFGTVNKRFLVDGQQRIATSSLSLSVS